MSTKSSTGFGGIVIIALLACATSVESSEDTATATGSNPPLQQHGVGTNIDTVTRLNNSLPKQDSLLGWSLPDGVVQFKEQLYRQHGLKLGVSYQSLYQKASATQTDKDSAWGGWFLFNAAWTPLNRGQDWQGKLVFSLDGRHTINSGSNASPGLFHLDTGSLSPTDAAYFDWDPYATILFWEQRVRKDKFAFRVGQQAGLSVLDPGRFDELRTSFTNSLVAGPVSIIPVGPPGLGVAAKWWPIEGSELYIRGIVNDINAPSGKVDWDGLFQYGEVFAGGEIGYNWIRSEDDFDHVHLSLWYADEVSTAPYPTEPGWGYKINGSKQWNKVVAFANYAYNTAEGGGFGTTNTRQAVNVGTGWVNPWGIRGEIAVAASWAEPLERGLREQSGLELYWKVLVISNLWLTPGIQYVYNPTFNTEEDGFSIVQAKFSLFF